jgi:hypothetical protein
MAMMNSQWCKFLSFSSVWLTMLIVAGCSGSDGTNGVAGADGADGVAGADGTTGAGGVPDQDIILQVDTNGDGSADTLAVMDPNSFAIKRSNTVDMSVDSSLNNSHKSYFHTGLQWQGGGGNLWAYDKETLVLDSRVDNPSFQMNREGVVGSAQVNTKSAATTANLSKDLKSFIGRPQLSKAEAAQVDMCDVMALAGSSGSSTKAPEDTIVHNMGYGPVGLETTPDGKMVIAGVRQGDHLLFIDNDPASPTFKTPVRFIDQRRGVIKDKTNAVVGTFTSQYTGFTGSTGTAPGNLLRDRTGNATGGEIDLETYVEPCDTAVISNFSGEVWFWSVDVDGDTYTLARVDTITSPTPTVVQITTPVVDNTALVGGASTLQTVGPWMGSMVNRVANGEMLGTSENEGENSESIWDLSVPTTPVEIGRYVPNLATIKGAGLCVGGAAGPTLTGPFVDQQDYAVNVDFTSTGGACTVVSYKYNSLPGVVSYKYNSLPGDDLTGLSGTSGSVAAADNVTTAYLAKNTPADPGPSYILNGLAGRAGTSEGNVASINANGVTFSDEIWLLTFRGGPEGNFDVFQVVDLSTDPPWLITEVIDLSSQFAGKFGQGNKFYQVVSGNLEIIDGNVKPRTARTVKLSDATTGALWTVRSVAHRTPLPSP